MVAVTGIMPEVPSSSLTSLLTSSTIFMSSTKSSLTLQPEAMTSTQTGRPLHGTEQFFAFIFFPQESNEFFSFGEGIADLTVGVIIYNNTSVQNG